MKTLFIIELIILMAADLFSGLYLAGSGSRDFSDIITLIDMFVGPLQIAPALVLIFLKKYHNIYFWAYLTLALCTIGVLIISVSVFHFGGYHDSFYLAMMYFSFILAHYFVFVLYKTTQLNHISI